MFIKDQEQNKIYLTLFGFIPAIAVCVSILLLASYFVSIYYVMSPRITLDEWTCNGKAGDIETWNTELNKLFIAKKFDPWNADIYMDIGRMYEWKALSGTAWNSGVKEARTEAIYYFEQATIYRPTWALAWANYAQSQLLNRVVNDDVFSAISNGLKFGRWQGETQQKLLWISVGIWKKLPENIKVQVREQITVIQGRKNAIEMLTKIAARFQWFDELIPLIVTNKDRQYLEFIRENPKSMRNLLVDNSNQQEFVCRVVSL